MEYDDVEIARGETGIRILFTLLFWLIARVLGTVLGVLVFFELIYTLVTQRLPGSRVRRFANRTLAYLYRITRYVTYNERDAPFPFRDFPPEVEPEQPFADWADTESGIEDAEEDERTP
jgi:hypothetical protein